MCKVLWSLEVNDLINFPKHRHPIVYDGPQEILLTVPLPYIQNSHASVGAVLHLPAISLHLLFLRLYELALNTHMNGRK